MIRLREILDEIDVSTGDYEGFTLDDVLTLVPSSLRGMLNFLSSKSTVTGPDRNGLTQYGIDPNNLEKKYTLKDLPEVLDTIKRMGSVLKEENDVLVMRYVSERTDIGYVVFDTQVEFKIAKNTQTMRFISGYLHTIPYERRFFVSPKSMLESTNVESVRKSYVVKQARGKGFGKMLYDAALSNVDALISDETLFQGSFGMWTNHIYKASKFFGALYSYGKLMYILPLGENPPADISKAFRGAWGFIAFGNNVPSRVTKMGKIFSGTNIDDITIVMTSPRMDFNEQVQDLFDNAESLDDIVVEQGTNKATLGDILPELLEIRNWSGWKNPMNPVGLFRFNDALVFAREESGGIYWDLL